jgi:hypothetical protein
VEFSRHCGLITTLDIFQQEFSTRKPTKRKKEEKEKEDRAKEIMEEKEAQKKEKEKEKEEGAGMTKKKESTNEGKPKKGQNEEDGDVDHDQDAGKWEISRELGKALTLLMDGCYLGSIQGNIPVDQYINERPEILSLGRDLFHLCSRVRTFFSFPFLFVCLFVCEPCGFFFFIFIFFFFAETRRINL